MTTASHGVALVATHLAHTDRRALSQAWYSALHVARDEPPRRVLATARLATQTVEHRRLAAPPIGTEAIGHELAARSGRDLAAPRAAVLHERRRPACEITRRVERAVSRLATVPKRRAGAQTIDVGGGRIRLLVRNDGHATRVIALCTLPLRERVERALAHARFTLAGSGVAVAR